MNIQPPDNLAFTASQIKFSRDIIVAHGNKPHLCYPHSTEKHKFKMFHTMVDEKILARSIHDIPVICDDFFILQYNALTQIFKECGNAAFGRAKGGKHAIM